VVARKNHRADRSQGRSWRLGWLTGRDDDGVHDLVGEGLALGAVPDREQPAEVAGRAVEQVREQAEERSSRPEGPARPLVDQPGPGDLFAPALPGGTLDEVLDFRRQHGAQHRAYARDLRQFVRDLASLDHHARDQAFADRREALADTADQLRRLARTSWRRPLATFGLGIAGSAVALAHGNPIAAGLTRRSTAGASPPSRPRQRLHLPLPRTRPPLAKNNRTLTAPDHCSRR